MNIKVTKCQNHSFIVLIRKIPNPQKLSDFRPISLVGCHHKVLARCWRIDCTWLLESSFSETQSTFVERRQILDGILIAN
jgi:hypothetical protein